MTARKEAAGAVRCMVRRGTGPRVLVLAAVAAAAGFAAAAAQERSSTPEEATPLETVLVAGSASSATALILHSMFSSNSSRPTSPNVHGALPNFRCNYPSQSDYCRTHDDREGQDNSGWARVQNKDSLVVCTPPLPPRRG